MRTTTPLTDQDPMPFGIYMRSKLQDVPTHHLYWVSTQPRVLKYYPALAAYIAACPRVITHHKSLQQGQPGQ